MKRGTVLWYIVGLMCVFLFKMENVWHLTLYLQVSFADNILDPDQAQQNVGPDLDPNRFTLMVFLKEFGGKSWFWKKSAADRRAYKFTQHAKS